MSTIVGDPTGKLTKYATAKIVILGDPGVGKTILGYKLAHGNSAEATPLPHHFWVVKDFSTRLPDDTQCEAVLWDLVRRPSYQAIYPIFLDDVDVALLLFDPTNKRNTLAGVKFWLDQLSHNAKLPPCVLVATRVDRGGLAISKDELWSFCESNRISGGYIETSTATGEGLDALREKIRALISWETLRETTGLDAINMVRRKVLELKGAADKSGAIIRSGDLQTMIRDSENAPIPESELLASAMLIRKHGHIEVLAGLPGEFLILLEPELLMNIASAVVKLAEDDTRGLGALSETQLLRGDISLSDLEALDEAHRGVLVEDVLARLINREICFRERYGSETLLVFPALIRQKRPPSDSAPAEDATYFVEGKVKNVYTALVVLLGYTNSLKRFNLWQNQVQYEYKDQPNQICGFKLADERENYIELVLQYENTPEDKRPSFQRLFEFFLCQREVTVRLFPPIVCPNGDAQSRVAMILRLRQGKAWTFCSECGKEFDLPKEEVLRPAEGYLSPWLQHERAVVELRKTYETYLGSVTGFWQQKVKPRCYLSHADDESKFVEKLSNDLGLAGIDVVRDKSAVAGGDHVVVIESGSYKQLWRSSANSFEGERSFIKNWLSSRAVTSIKIDPNAGSAFPHNVSACQPHDFSDTTHYPVSLFDLVHKLYSIPPKHADFERLRRALHEQWELTLTRPASEPTKEQRTTPLKVFISYAHKDEPFKNDLLTMVKPLERQGILEIWHDRKIEEGDEWRREIESAMNECYMALLFISMSFLASPFIQDKELPRLLQRRKEEGLCVVPIIIGPCMWQSEPVLNDLQALPKDAQPVSSFAEGHARDQVWVEIAQAIETRAKAKPML